MPVATFDTLKFSKALREAGVPEKQADAEAAVLSDVFAVNLRELVTKDDLKSELKLTKDELRAEIKGVRDELKGDIKGVRDELKGDIKSVRDELKGDIKSVRDELKGDIKGVRDELKHDMALMDQRLNAKIDQLAAKQNSDFTMVKWMLGALVTICSGIAVRLLLFPAK